METIAEKLDYINNQKAILVNALSTYDEKYDTQSLSTLYENCIDMITSKSFDGNAIKVDGKTYLENKLCVEDLGNVISKEAFSKITDLSNIEEILETASNFTTTENYSAAPGLFNINSNIRKFKSNSLTSISNFAFTNCALTELKLPNVKEIGQNFYYLDKTVSYKQLSAIDLPSLTSNASGYGFANLNKHITSLSAKYLQRIGNNMLIGTDYLSNIYVDNDVYKSIDNGYGDGITLIVSRDGKTLRTATHFISRISSDIIENLEPTALANNYQLSSAYFPNLKTISNFTFQKVSSAKPTVLSIDFGTEMATIPTCTINSFTNNSQVTVIIPNSDDFYNQLTSDANWKDRIDNNAVVIVRHE